MTEVFGQNYAKAYDAIYRSKDYQGEVALIERILASHGFGGPRLLLDLGCGTGNHAVLLAQRGHKVVGVDRSEGMLAQAREKMAAASCCLTFQSGDIRSVDLAKRFDAVLMMFSVLGYQYDDDDLTAALTTVRRHLDPGGLFIFDVWNGPAVLADRPGEREVTVVEEAARIKRNTHADLDTSRNLCRVTFNLERNEASGRIDRWQEEHLVRYYFPGELRDLLAHRELDLLSLHRFPDGEAPADERAWNIIGVGRAR